MAKIPTDERLLAEIYKRYERAFGAFSDENKTRSTKIWVPIDIDSISKRFRCDPDLVFGRLYYHMNAKYGSHTAKGDSVNMFEMRIGQDRHCVNFPLVASVLADLQEDKSRFRVSTRMAALSLLVSALSILIAIFWKGGAVMLP
ncbi:hypothetical protein [Hyphomonas sp.]|uniref:hypothetical protein n=1 Tax=Hyphomonas sp. TaxID=87 RepID=UPI0035283DF2